MFLEPSRERRAFPPWLLLLLALTLAGNVLAWLGLGLLPDEAYYWVWSQRLELSYFDHPPLVAWLMRPFTDLFGDGAAVIRLPAVLSWLVGAVLAYDLARRAYGQPRAGGLAVLVWTTLPLVQAGFHIVTPDSALIIFTWCTYYLAWRAVEEHRPALWGLTGICAGLALLGKYPAVLILGGLFLALLMSRAGRRQLAGPWPWFGALLALVTFIPVLAWNWRHDWISFAFQLGHGVQRSVAADPWTMLLMFVGGQMAVAMPWTFLAMAGASFGRGGPRALSGYGRALFATGFWLPLLVFGAAGLTADSGPNWPETAYVPGTILLAGALNRWLYPPARARGRARPLLLGLVVLAVLTGVLLVNLLRFPHWLQQVAGEDMTPKRTQLSQAYGWDQVDAELRRLLPEVEATHPRGADCGIIVGNHASAGMVAWLLDAPQRVGVTMQARMSQYHLWAREAAVPERLCLFIEKYDREDRERDDIPGRLSLPEGEWRQLSVVEAKNPDLSLRWYVFYVPVTQEEPAGAAQGADAAEPDADAE
ncbi:MAG: hypothetical protein CVV05_11580 [Gammaproteobacteria bacterium HGW-Gammaproteobacteria-1]|jgi:hypothetical protein|nr:MAG: hypothetical protein CVV05_11580 [Gammaproteobacteria bacterium HGW-Gammaproteobacteria-1]